MNDSPIAMARHLIHVGFPKSGSTYLQHWFALHPDLSYEPGGLAGLDSVYGVARLAAVPHKPYRYRVTSYEGLSAPQANAGWSLDYRPDGLPPAARQKHACTILAELFPNATILIVTRGFRSMILSSYSQYLRVGGNLPLVDLLLPAEGSQIQGDGLTPAGQYWNYDRLIEEYRVAFGTDNVIVLPYELLRDNPGEFTAHVERRLSLQPFSCEIGQLNPALSGEELAWYPLLAKSARLLPTKLFKLYRNAAFSGRLRGFISLLQRVRPLEPVSGASLPQTIVEKYRGWAESLRDEPLFASYHADYLLDRPPGAGSASTGRGVAAIAGTDLAE